MTTITILSQGRQFGHTRATIQENQMSLNVSQTRTNPGVQTRGSTDCAEGVTQDLLDTGVF